MKKFFLGLFFLIFCFIVSCSTVEKKIDEIASKLRIYQFFLHKQASGKYQKLPLELRQIIQPYYQEIDLQKVDYAENVDTVHGQGITIGYRIYFPRKINLDTYQDLRWMLHELQHVVQYKREGGELNFLKKYSKEAGKQIFINKSFSIHDNIHLEQEADQVAYQVLDLVWKDLWENIKKKKEN
jgi:hypothetical protein